VGKTCSSRRSWRTAVPCPGFAVLFANGAPYESRTRLFRLKIWRPNRHIKAHSDFSRSVHTLAGQGITYGVRIDVSNGAHLSSLLKNTQSLQAPAKYGKRPVLRAKKFAVPLSLRNDNGAGPCQGIGSV